jgi:hypothetical protein
MKKSKFAIVIALGLVLCLLCGVTTTFSWFSRPRTESGDSLRWSGQYKISNGKNISIKTVESSDDGSTFGENAVTNFGGSLEAGKRRYFCTEISNSGNAEQNVSLFIKGLKTASASGLYVGVNKPLKTYRSYNDIVGSNSTYTKTTLGKYRIYFNANGVKSWNDSDTTTKIRYSLEDKDNPSWTTDVINMTYVKYVGGHKIMYADIPITAKRIQIYVNNSPSGANATPCIRVASYCPKISPTNCYVFTLRAGVENGYHNCDTYSFNNPLTDCANFVNCYDSINIPLGRTFNAGLVAGTDYVGSSISYSSSSNSVFKVGANGVITPVAEGTAKLTTTIKGGAYGDTYSVTTEISVTSVSTDSIDTPIVTNLEIKPKATDGPTVSKVYWYIKNESSSTITYTLDDVYISL